MSSLNQHDEYIDLSQFCSKTEYSKMINALTIGK